MPWRAADDPAERYFSAIAAALAGLDIFMRDDRSPLYRHGIVPRSWPSILRRLEKSFSCWRNRLGFMEKFRISRAESGFPVFQNVLELENDRRQARSGWPIFPMPTAARRDGRLHPAPQGVSGRAAEVDGRAALSRGRQGRRDVQPVHAGRDGQGVGQSEDDAALLPGPLGDLRRHRQPAADLHGRPSRIPPRRWSANWSTPDGKLNDKVDIPLPVEGLLNPELAHRFDDFTEKNSAYSLSPATIAADMLRRQQADAIVAARQRIVEGIVGMVDHALSSLNERDIVDLDEEHKAAMVSNLMVVLVSDRGAQPVVNSGSLYTSTAPWRTARSTRCASSGACTTPLSGERPTTCAA